MKRIPKWIGLFIFTHLLTAGMLFAETLVIEQAADRASAKSKPLPDYAVTVELENVSGEDKTDWPVILMVAQVLGRALPPGSVNPRGFHIIDEKGVELPWTLETVPPADTPGNDEIIVIIPKLAKDGKLSLRITNTAVNSSAFREGLDTVNNPNNLLQNPGFETAVEKGAEGWNGPCRLDTEIKRSGKSSLLLSGAKRQEITYARPLPLHKGSFYYFGAWGRTDNVSRHALYNSAGGCFQVQGFDCGYETTDPNLLADAKKLAREKAAEINPQCATRDWSKTRFGKISDKSLGVLSISDWGIPALTATASAEEAKLTICFDQRPQFFMPKDKTEGKWWLDDIVLFEQPKVVIRHDELLKPHLADGLFVFSTPSNLELGRQPRGAKPFPREKLTRLERPALRGQRAVFFIGLYHTRPVKDIQVTVTDNALKGPGNPLPAEIEWAPGLLGGDSTACYQLRPLTVPVSSAQTEGLPYFVVTFPVPQDAKPGKYTGTLTVSVEGNAVSVAPVTLCVQDLELPVIRDVYIGMIIQGDNVPFNDEGVALYAKSNFTSVTRFGKFLSYVKSPESGSQVDIADLEKKLAWLKGYGITAGVAPFQDFDLGSKHDGGTLFKKSGGNPDDTTKAKFQQEVKRIEELLKSRPDLPRLIYMDWDEPVPGEKWIPSRKKHGGPCDMMNWIPEVAPDAPHTLDAHFYVFDQILKYYNMPNFDDPSDFCGPELYRYMKSLGKDYGFAAPQSYGERARYQTGMMMAASGARYMHLWHANAGAKLMDMLDGKVTRAISMVSAGEGVDDYKVFYLLKAAIVEAEKGADSAKKTAAQEAQKYLDGIFAVWTADHSHAPSVPYLGFASSWGGEGFYQHWQETMARSVAKIKGVAWIE